MLRFEASGEELQQLTNLMTVNETYFFREEYQFQCLVRSIWPEIGSRKTDKRPIRIWQFPLLRVRSRIRFALYLLEYWAAIKDWDIEIVSSDIDTQSFGQARQGYYTDRSVQHLPVALLRKYFARSG